jgi:hypothetical protein
MGSHPTMKILERAGQIFQELTSAEDKLFKLAQEKFHELSDSEYKLFRGVANGKPIDYQTKNDFDDNPENANNWGENRIIRGDRLRWLCLEPEIWQFCLPQGIDISGAKIEGALSLNFGTVEIPLRFFQCYFSEALQLKQAKLRQLDLSGTHIASSEIVITSDQPPQPTSIYAEHVSITGFVFLNDGFQANGCVSLVGAIIGGDLECARESVFTNKDGDSLFAQNINIAGNIFLSNGFRSTGCVNLSIATIGGILECTGGKFTNAKGKALVADYINVTKSVNLRENFQANGCVSLAGATIGGDLDCSNGAFTNANGDALVADSINVAGSVNLNAEALVAEGINVAGSVNLSAKFQSNGCVRLAGATIGGDLNCIGGTFINENGDALVAERINVAGSIFLREGFHANGCVRLASSTIERDLDCSNGAFTNANGDALVADSINVAGSVNLSDQFQANGCVSLAGATIGGDLNCIGGTFTNKSGDALVAHSINVSGNVFLREGFQAKGGVSLAGATIGGRLDCFDGTFINENGNALDADSISVTRSVYLNDKFQAKGRVSLHNAKIGNTLKIDGVADPKEMHLDLEFAKIQTLEHHENSFPKSENLHLNGLVYESLGKDFLNNSNQHLHWLRLQPKATFSSQPYEQLAKILQSTGKGDEAVAVLIGSERDELQYGKLGLISKAWGRFLGITIRFGYRPQLALLWALGVVVIGAVIFSVGYNKGLITPTEKDCKSSPPNSPETCSNNPNYSKFDPLIYSLDVFLPIIDLRLKGAWQPNANKTWQPNTSQTNLNNDIFPFIKSGTQLRYYFWFQIISGWALTTLWVSGFTGLVRNTKK